LREQAGEVANALPNPVCGHRVTIVFAADGKGGKKFKGKNGSTKKILCNTTTSKKDIGEFVPFPVKKKVNQKGTEREQRGCNKEGSRKKEDPRKISPRKKVLLAKELISWRKLTSGPGWHPSQGSTDNRGKEKRNTSKRRRTVRL